MNNFSLRSRRDRARKKRSGWKNDSDYEVTCADMG
jgi:hypothetical protein